jgi:1,4-dihydroxy-2-naphthoate octaprenyltransferase
LHRSTFQLLRFHFSFFLLPVYLFALSQQPQPEWGNAALILFILHFLVYPASNGYNSYMDRDEGSIGGIKNPMQPTRQLYYLSIVMDIVAILLSLMVSIPFAVGLLFYVLASRAYSYRGIRLKKFPVIGYLTVIIFQGGVIFWIVYHGTGESLPLDVPLIAVLASILLIGGFYPLTQIYQHEADKADNVTTISSWLGYRGTFIFTGIVYILAFACIAVYFLGNDMQKDFVVLNVMMLPIIVYFFIWAAKVWKNVGTADFTHTMRMNLLACTCTNLAFIIILIMRRFF